MISQRKMESDTLRKNKGLSANALKLIAIVAMVIAHFGAFLISYEQAALSTLNTFINYITAPIIFFFLVEGYHHTNNKNSYAIRLAIFAIAGYVPFIMAFRGEFPSANNFLNLNVGFTLFLSFYLLRVQNEITR